MAAQPGGIGPEADKETGGNFCDWRKGGQARRAVFDAAVGVDINFKGDLHRRRGWHWCAALTCHGRLRRIEMGLLKPFDGFAQAVFEGDLAV